MRTDPAVMGCLHDPANVQQTSNKCNAGRLLDRVNTLLAYRAVKERWSLREILSLPINAVKLQHFRSISPSSLSS